jgi:hypothetical protein
MGSSMLDPYAGICFGRAAQAKAYATWTEGAALR